MPNPTAPLVSISKDTIISPLLDAKVLADSAHRAAVGSAHSCGGTTTEELGAAWTAVRAWTAVGAWTAVRAWTALSEIPGSWVSGLRGGLCLDSAAPEPDTAVDPVMGVAEAL